VNRLYFGDCLEVLKNEIADESVNLIYLDPPFNSNRDYNLLFAAPDGHTSEAQIGAFEDTWHWGEQAESEFRLLLSQSNTDLAEVIASMRRFLHENDLMAYLTMMASRLLEMHRVLSSDGSLYLHCDPKASHYLKVLLDGVFGPEFFRNEIVWKRTSGHSDSARFGCVHDVLLYYSRGTNPRWNQLFESYGDEYAERYYRYRDDDGRRFMSGDLGAAGLQGGGYQYEWKGVTRLWRCPEETMARLDGEGRIFYTRNGIPRLKRYLDEAKGTPLNDVWADIEPLRSWNKEKLGYPTQKPQVFLERIIRASSNEGDLILDPFCGCGTAVHAAQKLGRRWIGIDITHLAISLIEKRLQDAFPGIEFEVHGTPKDLDGARDLASRDKYQFQWWACSLVCAQPWQSKKKGADRGIDGIIYFQDEKGPPKKIVVSVKGGEAVGRTMIADLKNTVEREKAQIGLFVTLASPTKEMVKEALTAGFYESPNFRSGEFPKIQILTIEGLLSGTQRPRYPDLSQGAYTFKRTTQELEAASPSSTDLFEEST
jgi:adenine specific DNA methylase Mod